MAKKHKKENELVESFGGLAGFLKESMFFFAKDLVKEKFDSAMNYIEERVSRMQTRMLKSMASLMLLVGAGVLIIASLYFFLIDSMGLPRWIAMLVFAVVLALFALMIDYTNRR